MDESAQRVVCNVNLKDIPNCQKSLICNNGQLDFRISRHVLACNYSTPSKKGFIGGVFENIKDEMSKNKELKVSEFVWFIYSYESIGHLYKVKTLSQIVVFSTEFQDNIKKFREEREKLEESDALKQARKKFEMLESETSKSSEVLKKAFGDMKEKISESIEHAQKTDVGKKGKEITEGLSKSAKEAMEAVEKSGKAIGESNAFKSFSEGVKAIKEEIDESTIHKSGIYQAPNELKKRDELTFTKSAEKIIKPNESATDVELHKDSKWFQNWEKFKDNNVYVNKLFDWKIRYDESDNPVVRASRLFTDKVTELFGGVFQKTELSEVLTEITKIDPSFDRYKFVKHVESVIIPNVLEAMIRGDLEILRDWCHEAAYNALAVPIKQAKTLGYKYDSKILDVSHVDLEMGKMMEQGPVLIVTFQSQQIMAIRNASGGIVEGDAEKVMRIHYVWALCRDQSVFDPYAAWKLIDLSYSGTEQWF
ncbi:Mitochondrial import inner membrane translocase subunit TIM44 [Nymphon striatum]|nr:Mitochondrial import inner membrane translocase subunit TIM44 [Nymphon striatum]